jgi:hypothetical protein
MWPSMTFEVILKYARIHNVTIHTNFYQDQAIKECAMKNFLKFPERRKDWVFVRCKRTYNWKNLEQSCCLHLDRIINYSLCIQDKVLTFKTVHITNRSQ